jgi:hypothetical protein
LEEKVSVDELSNGGPGYPGHPDIKSILKGCKTGDLIERPEHKVFSLAMLGGGMVYGAAHPYDYPWGSLREATVVDVGGGLGKRFARLVLLVLLRIDKRIQEVSTSNSVDCICSSNLSYKIVALASSMQNR